MREWENTSPDGTCQGLLSRFHVEQLNSFGKRLRIARLGALERVGREISQVALGERIGVSSQAVSAWEGDVSPPTVEMVAKLALELGVTPGWLAFGQEPRYPAAKELTGKGRAQRHAGKTGLPMEEGVEKPLERPMRAKRKRA
jgi:transcriptional regulator with XRE-family HTH domain